ncbi:PQQ-binding-like beta-propeller repeat protein [Streptomyces nigra]|uniref:outer membrane protein assembly factor BamB family protein n=1 Tax=Streptomyces nigra TaxID=1827580 RepID=UPI003824DF8A
MTQPPPPPPNQPPGGFGPPQGQPPQQPGQPEHGQQPPTPPQGPPTPPAGPPQQPGYGYPQAPQQPGYGYPQAPQQPQQPTPPYGYPGQQPNPYTQQQPQPYPTPNPYGQQPGYGYPQQQPYATQPVTTAGGGANGGRIAVIVAAVVVVIALVVGGVFLLKPGDDGGKDETASSSGGTGGGGDDGQGGGGDTPDGIEKVPAETNSDVLFKVPSPKVDEDTSVVVAGSWLTEKAYVKSGVSEIVGYDPVKGTELWTIPLPGPVCQAGRHITDGHLTAIAFQPAKPTKDKPSHGCSQIAAIDLDTGKKLWTKTAKAGSRELRFDNLTVSGGTVAAGGTSGGAAFDLKSGRSLWTPKADDDCYDLGYGGGPKLVVVRKCGSYDQPQLHIQTVDPKSGKVISEYKMAEGVEYASVISTDPLVVAAEVGESDAIGISDAFSIDNKTGKLRIRIPLPADKFAARCSGVTTIEACTGVVVGNDRLYVATKEHSGGGEYGRTNEIVAFDLATGKQTGQRADAGDRYTITPLRMDGGNVIAYKRPPYDKGGQIVSIDGGDFKETKLLENPAARPVRDIETRMSPDYAEILYSQGRLYMSSRFASSLGSSGEQRWHLIAFGAKG